MTYIPGNTIEMPNDVLVAVFNADDGGLDADVWTRLRNWLQPENVEVLFS